MQYEADRSRPSRMPARTSPCTHGPSAHLVHGSQEQTISFYVMAHALGFDAHRREADGHLLGRWF